MTPTLGLALEAVAVMAALAIVLLPFARRLARRRPGLPPAWRGMVARHLAETTPHRRLRDAGR